MLDALITYLTPEYTFLNAFGYLSTRAVAAFLTAFVVALVFGKPLINLLHKLKFGQSIRTNGPETHLKKQGTPTMGGILIILAIIASTLLWGNLSNLYLWLSIFVLIGFGAVGFVDDYLKIKHRNSDGLSAKQKYLALSFVAICAILMVYFTQDGNATKLSLPFFKNFTPNLGLLFIVIAYFTIVGASNAINITDGLDGLAIVPSVLCAIGLGVIAWLTSNVNYANYLSLLYIPQASEIIVICAALAGAGIGFLWFNAYPAQVFMGDVGSLALGGFLGFVAVLIRQEFLLILMGGIFVVETLSTMIQVGYFRYTKKKFGEGRRVFLMAPFHHHLEKLGWPETKIIARFWIISLILLIVSLITLKLR